MKIVILDNEVFTKATTTIKFPGAGRKMNYVTMKLVSWLK